MASRNIEDLHESLRFLARRFLDECRRQGIDVIITCTYRSGEDQDALYAQGRTTRGSIVTNARAGQSKHNFTVKGVPASKAFDVVPLVNGKPEWNASNPVWQTVGEIGEKLGLEWAGRWTRFREFPHFQLKD